MNETKKCLWNNLFKAILCLMLVSCFTLGRGANEVHAATKPAQPVLVSLKELNTTQAVLTWKKVTGADGYRVFRRTVETEKWKTVKTIKNGSTLTFTDKNLVVGQKYYYTVRACKTSGTTTLWSTWDKSGLNLVAGASTIKLSKKSVTLDRGKTTTLKLIGSEIAPTWHSANKNIATISSKGKITAKAPGKVKVYATVSGKKFYCTVTVRPAFKASATSISLEKGNTGFITVTSEYDAERLNSTIKNSAIASGSWGGWNGNDNTLYITAKAVGTTQIVLTSKASERTITVDITVTNIDVTKHFDEVADWIMKNGSEDEGNYYRLVLVDESQGATANILYVKSKKQMIFSYMTNKGTLSSTTEMIMNRADMTKGKFAVKHYFRDTEDMGSGETNAVITAKSFKQTTNVPFTVISNNYDMTDDYVIEYSNTEYKAAMKIWKQMILKTSHNFKELGFSVYK